MAKPTILPEWDETEVNSVEPDATHKAEGWLAPAGVPEKPPYQSFNFWQNSVWKWLNEINIKGILGYDALTDYLADLSYVVGSDGNLYQCGINNGPSSSVVNPVGDVTGTWMDIINTIPVTARGYIDGLILENDTDTDHDIKINIGICRDKTDALPIQLIAAMVKQIDANWAAGDGNGGFPSGLTLTADTCYHFYIIMKADGTVDAGFDTSLIATNLLADATNYIYYRRVGSVLTDGSDNIYQFIQVGDWFIWKDPILDFTEASGVVEVTKVIRVPIGVSVFAYFNWVHVSATLIYFKHPDATDIAPVVNVAPLPQHTGASEHNAFSCLTNVSGQITYRSQVDNTIRLSTISYIDFRGKDA